MWTSKLVSEETEKPQMQMALIKLGTRKFGSELSNDSTKNKGSLLAAALKAIAPILSQNIFKQNK